MKKRALTILLCATLILSLAACGGGGKTDSTEPPSNSTGGTQQNDEPTTPPPSESDKTPDTTEPQDTDTTEPQGTETSEPSKSSGLIDKTPLYLGGDIAVTAEDLDVLLMSFAGGGQGLIEFDNYDTLDEITVGFTNNYPNVFYGYEVQHEITLGAGNMTVSDFYNQLFEQLTAVSDAANLYPTFEHFVDTISSLKSEGHLGLNLLDEEYPDEEPLDLDIEEVDYILINMPYINSNFYEIDGAGHDISSLVEVLGVPRYVKLDAGANVYVDGYIWDAGDHWLTLSTGGSVLSYFSKSISKDLLDGHFLDPIIMSIKDHLDEISQ